MRALVDTNRTYSELCQVYLAAFQAADNNGQWEKGLDYLNKALGVAKENVEKGAGPLTEQRDWWIKKGQLCKGLPGQERRRHQGPARQGQARGLRAGPHGTGQGLGEGPGRGRQVEQVLPGTRSTWPRENVEDFQKFVGIQDKKIIEAQQADIDGYKPHPGNKIKWVDAVISNKSYLEAYPREGGQGRPALPAAGPGPGQPQGPERPGHPHGQGRGEGPGQEEEVG